MGEKREDKNKMVTQLADSVGPGGSQGCTLFTL